MVAELVRSSGSHAERLTDSCSSRCKGRQAVRQAVRQDGRLLDSGTYILSNTTTACLQPAAPAAPTRPACAVESLFLIACGGCGSGRCYPPPYPPPTAVPVSFAVPRCRFGSGLEHPRYLGHQGPQCGMSSVEQLGSHQGLSDHEPRGSICRQTSRMGFPKEKRKGGPATMSPRGLPISFRGNTG